MNNGMLEEGVSCPLHTWDDTKLTKSRRLASGVAGSGATSGRWAFFPRRDDCVIALSVFNQLRQEPTFFLYRPSLELTELL